MHPEAEEDPNVRTPFLPSKVSKDDPHMRKTCCQRIPATKPWHIFALFLGVALLMRVVVFFHYNFLPTGYRFSNFLVGVAQDITVTCLLSLILLLLGLVYPVYPQTSRTLCVYRYSVSSLVVASYYLIYMINVGLQFLTSTSLDWAKFGFASIMFVLADSKTIWLCLVGLIITLFALTVPTVLFLNKLEPPKDLALHLRSNKLAFTAMGLLVAGSVAVVSTVPIYINPNPMWNLFSVHHPSPISFLQKGCGSEGQLYNLTGSEVFTKEGLEDYPLTRRVLAYQNDKVIHIKAAKPNIIIVGIESFRALDMDAFSSTGDVVTPNLNRMLKQGYLFNNYHTNNGYTNFAYASILTGLLTYEKDCNSNTSNIPKFLVEHGYRTFGVTNTYSSKDKVFQHCRNLYKDSGADMYVGEWLDKDMYNLSVAEKVKSKEYTKLTDSQLMTEAIKLIEAHHTKNEPFFSMISTIDLHEPYRWNKKFKTKYQTFSHAKNDAHNHYLNILHYDDQIFGEFMDSLKARGLSKNTVVMITGDHGIYFDKLGAARMLGRVSDQTLRVPLLILSEDLQEKGQQSARAASHVDLFPTIVDLVGVPKGGVLMHGPGRSLLRKDSHPPRIYHANTPNSLGMRTSEYIYSITNNKLLVYNRSDGELKHDVSSQLDPSLALSAEHHLRCVYQAVYDVGNTGNYIPPGPQTSKGHLYT